MNLPEGWFNFSLVLVDPKNPKKPKSYINHLIIKDKKIVSQITDDVIWVKDPLEVIYADQDTTDEDSVEVRGTPGAGIPTPPPQDQKTETHIIEDTDPWAELEAGISPFATYLDKELRLMGNKIYKLARDMGLANLIDMLPEKKTNKKYRTVIIAAQAGRVAEAFQDLRNDQILKGLKKAGPGTVKKETSHPRGGDDTKLPESDGSVETNAALEEQGTSNKFGIEVSDMAEGETQRDFQDARKIAFSMSDNGIDTRAWNRIASQLIYNQSKGLTYLSVFKDKEMFCKQANTVDIHYFINQHEG